MESHDWINPITLETKENAMWMPEAPQVPTLDGMLCPSQRRMPNFGSLWANAWNSVIWFLRMPLFVLLYLPVMSDFTCPLQSHGHSILQTCGKDLFSLDNMFSSLFALNSNFWQSFAIIANAFGPGPPQTFINGMTMFADSQWTIIRPRLVSSFLTIGNIDASNAINVIQNSIAGLPPIVKAAQHIATNPVAVAQVYYKVFTKMLVSIVLEKRDVRNVFWNSVADGIADWESIVLSRMRQSCAGLSLMTGYNSPLGMLIMQYCNAFVDWTQAGPIMASVFFVDIPLTSCVCVNSHGQSFNDNIIQNCYPVAPDSMKPLLVALLDSNAAICPTLTNMTKAHFTEALDNMFSNLEGGTRHIGSVIDWFVGDEGSGQCNNFNQNPFVVSLLPQPVDYWRVCGKTQRCRYRCLDEFTAFEQVKQSFRVTESVTTNVQSLFFNSQDIDTYIPFTPIALLEIANCTVPCGYVQPNDRCFAMVGIKLNIQIIHYCVPSDLNSNIRRARDPVTVGTVNDILQIEIIYTPEVIDFYSSFKVLARTKTAIYLCYTECVLYWTASDLGALEINNMFVFGRQIILQLVTEKNEYMQTTFVTKCSSISFQFTWPTICTGNLWPRVDITRPICALDASYQCTSVLFVPNSQSGTLEVCSRQQPMTFVCSVIPMQKSFIYNAKLGLMAHTARVNGNYWLVFATNAQSSYWLQISKFNVVEGSSSFQHSTDIAMTVNIIRECSLDNCIGCTELSVQRLCYAALQCQLARCIGTQVHEARPMCAIGMFIQSLVSQQLSLVQGSWLEISETIANVISLQQGFAVPSRISWPDQAFYGFICASKDISATGIAIAVASINGIVQAVVNDPNLNLRQQWTNNAMAKYTMVLTAVTNFLNQLALFPLYSLIATQKTFICSANSLLSLITPGTITIGDASIQDYSSKAAGRCLSQYFSESVQGEGSGTNNVGALIAGAIQNFRLAWLQRGLEVLVHPTDAMFTWVSGCVSGIQDIVQSADPNCKLPNFGVKNSFHCACGDSSFQIIDQRAQETWQQQAFWCSTTMNMIDTNGQTRYIWNPYSLAQLKTKLINLDSYLECLANSNQCDAPSDPIFDQQQVRLHSTIY